MFKVSSRLSRSDVEAEAKAEAPEKMPPFRFQSFPKLVFKFW
jgi:hypothetical protein